MRKATTLSCVFLAQEEEDREDVKCWKWYRAMETILRWRRLILYPPFWTQYLTIESSFFIFRFRMEMLDSMMTTEDNTRYEL